MNPAFRSVGVHLLGQNHQAVRVAVTGELDIHTTEEFRTATLALLAHTRAGRCELDLSQVGFCAVAGLRALLRVRQAVDQAGCRLVITAVSPAVDMLLALSGAGPLLSYPPGSGPVGSTGNG